MASMENHNRREEYVGDPRQGHGVALAAAGTLEVTGMGWRTLVHLLHGFNGDKTESNWEEKKMCGACTVLHGSHGDVCCQEKAEDAGRSIPRRFVSVFLY
jgi:hypothetical protein